MELDIGAQLQSDHDEQLSQDPFEALRQLIARHPELYASGFATKRSWEPCWPQEGAVSYL